MKISTARTLLLHFFTSIFLLFTIFFFFFSPLSHHFSKPILQKALSFFDRHNSVNDAVLPTSVYIHHHHRRRWGKQLSLQTTSPPVDKNDVDDVVVLTEKNFSDFVNRNQYVMLNFYAPWCYWSQKLAPEYAAAATMVKKRKGKAVLAKIDATQEPELAWKFKIKWYPTMYFLVGGVHKILYDFTEERTRDSIANWVYQKMNGGDVQTLTTMEEAERILAAKSVIVLGFLDNVEGQDSKELAAVSKLHIDVNFYQTFNVDVANLFHIDTQIKRPALIMLNREGINHSHFVYEGQFTRSAIADFVSIYKLPSVITFTLEDASNIFENPMKKLWLFTHQRSWHVVSIFEEAANAFKGKLLFVHVETGTEGSIGRGLAYEFGIPEADGAPRVVADYRENGDSKKHIYHGELTFNDIKSFAEEFLEDKFLNKLSLATKTIIRLPLHSHTSDPSSIPHAY